MNFENTNIQIKLLHCNHYKKTKKKNKNVNLIQFIYNNYCFILLIFMIIFLIQIYAKQINVKIG